MTLSSAPARVGMALLDVDTPALLIDLDAYERNLNKMQSFADDAGLRLRPHAKTHKCAVIAGQQMALGAVGVCCQKVSEAEALVYAGVNDVFVSNEVIGAPKLERMAAMAKLATVGVCVDDADNVDDLSRVAERYGVTLDVLVEIDVGAGRCGVATAGQAVELAGRIAAAPGLRFQGLQAYQGAAQHVRAHDARRAAIEQAAMQVEDTCRRLKGEGLDCETISGAGTGTFPFEAQTGVYTELQCGSYIFMDADYGRNRTETGDYFRDFENSLFVWTTVMSKSRPGVAVVDAGLKAVSVDSGLPLVHGVEQVAYVGVSDEHGQLDTAQADDRVRLGDKLKLIPGHCDPTVNLYDWYVGYRRERVESVWPIVARGAVL
jgi:3-hydroxy-D-aspartate aldolase